MQRCPIFSTLIFVGLAGCSASPPGDIDLEDLATHHSSPVIAGQLASAAEVYATVALTDQASAGAFCTGTLIAPQVVLTAAHCVVDTAAADVQVQLGAVDPTAQGTAVQASAIVPHPEYAAWGGPTVDEDGLTEDRDIAVIVLETAAPAAAPMAPLLSLAEWDFTLSEGDEVLLAGYGLTNLQTEAGGELNVGETVYVRRVASEFMAGGEGAGSCYGDSGGPVYLDVGGSLQLIGVVSRAAWTAVAECGDEGVYTMAAAFEGWIEEVSGGLYIGSGQDADLEPPGDAPSCLGLCDGENEAGCFCDQDCEEWGDCCPDYQAICVDGDVVGDGDGDGDGDTGDGDVGDGDHGDGDAGDGDGDVGDGDTGDGDTGDGDHGDGDSGDGDSGDGDSGDGDSGDGDSGDGDTDDGDSGDGDTGNGTVGDGDGDGDGDGEPDHADGDTGDTEVGDAAGFFEDDPEDPSAFQAGGCSATGPSTDSLSLFGAALVLGALLRRRRRSRR